MIMILILVLTQHLDFKDNLIKPYEAKEVGLIGLYLKLYQDVAISLKISRIKVSK